MDAWRKFLASMPKREIIPEPIVPLSQLCNVCHTVLKMRWYRCLSCYSFRLCVSCYERKCCWAGHFHVHPIQCVLTKEAQELFYQEDGTHIGPFVKTYTCPRCAKVGFSYNTLQEHLLSTHYESTDWVNCPMCYSLPNMKQDKEMYQNLVHHLTNNHHPDNCNVSDVSSSS